MKYVIGKQYPIDCIWYNGEWIPIIGEPHVDNSDCLNTPVLHYHSDGRFIKDHDPTKVLTVNYKIKPTKVMKICHRTRVETPSYPFALYHMIQKYKDKKINCTRCPHKGTPLNDIEPDENGHIRCHSHGLRFDSNKQKVALTGKWYIMVNGKKHAFSYPLIIKSDNDGSIINKINVFEEETNIFIGTINLRNPIRMDKRGFLQITGENCHA